VTRLKLYDHVAYETTAIVIRRYSTSFGMASRLRSGCSRARWNVALVRLPTNGGRGGGCQPRYRYRSRALDDFERETRSAIDTSFRYEPQSVRLIALTTGGLRFSTELTTSFFGIDKMDLEIMRPGGFVAVLRIGGV